GAWSRRRESQPKAWSHLSWRTLFCKNSEEIRSPRRGGISKIMPDKSTSSNKAAAEPAEVQEAQGAHSAQAPQRKIYPIVKYGDPILEKSTPPVQKFDAALGELAEDMFASMYAASGVGLAAPQIGLSLRLAVVDVTSGKNPEAKIVLANPEIVHFEGEKREE